MFELIFSHGHKFDGQVHIFTCFDKNSGLDVINYLMSENSIAHNKSFRESILKSFIKNLIGSFGVLARTDTRTDTHSPGKDLNDHNKVNEND